MNNSYLDRSQDEDCPAKIQKFQRKKKELYSPLLPQSMVLPSHPPEATTGSSWHNPFTVIKFIRLKQKMAKNKSCRSLSYV